MKPSKNIVPAINRLFPALLVMVLVVVQPVPAQPGRVLVPEGAYHSVLPEIPGEPVPVPAFYMDVHAVTNEDFLLFLKDNEQWRRSQIPAVYAGEGYLRHWKSDLNPGLDVLGKNRPVTRISWYAANAYCRSVDGRLPTLHEWEYSAQLMDFGSKEEMNRFSAKLIAWYSGVDTQNSHAVGSSGINNKYGVEDQFGLIMEWVEDFKPIIADALSLDCGTVGRMQSLGSVYSYAASIRYITRMSFKPTSVTGMLGFRCAYDADNIEHQMQEEL